MTRGEQKTLGELIQLAQHEKAQHEGDTQVRFDFGNFVPTEGSCYRGSYAEMAINYKPWYKLTLDDFVKMLCAEVGETHEGWKGGEYTMTEDTPLWAAATYGDCTGTAIVGLRYVDGVIVIDTRYEKF